MPQLFRLYLLVIPLLQAAGAPAAPAPPAGRTGGFLGPIIDIVLYIIQGFYSLTHSYGLSIILTAIFINVMLLSLNMAQLRSMKVMSLLAPVQKQLQEWYKGRQKELNQKMMELYTHLKINPLSGCLPMFLQMFIFFGIFRALTSPVIADHDFAGIKLIRAVYVRSTRGVVEHNANMLVTLDDEIGALTGQPTIMKWTFIGAKPELSDVIMDLLKRSNTLATQPYKLSAVGNDIVDSDINHVVFNGKDIALYFPPLVLIVIYMITTFLYQREMRKLTPAQTQSNAMMNPNFMGFMIAVFSVMFPAGVMMYYIVFNVSSALQYALIAPRLKLSFSPADIDEFLANARPTARVERAPKDEEEAKVPPPSPKGVSNGQPPPPAGEVRRVKGRRRR